MVLRDYCCSVSSRPRLPPVVRFSHEANATYFFPNFLSFLRLMDHHSYRIPAAVAKAATALNAAKMIVDVRMERAAANLRSLMSISVDCVEFGASRELKVPLIGLKG